MSATIVTGYVRLDSPWRSHESYVELGRRLLGLGLPTVAFYDGAPSDLRADPDVHVLPASLPACWFYEASRGATSPAANPEKDTTDYHVVQHQKTGWLAEVAAWPGADLLVWIDWGILHIEAIRERHIVEFMERVESAPRDRVTLPSIWCLWPRSVINWHRPCWFLAGGVAVVPARLARWWHDRCVEQATAHVRSTGETTWEVNTWAAVARCHMDRFNLYQADHDETLFTGYGL